MIGLIRGKRPQVLGRESLLSEEFWPARYRRRAQPEGSCAPLSDHDAVLVVASRKALAARRARCAEVGHLYYYLPDIGREICWRCGEMRET